MKRKKKISRGNRLYIMLLLLVGILTLAFFAGAYKRASGWLPQSETTTVTTTTTTTETTTETTTLSAAEMETVANKFYENAVFIGDSIMSGFATYAQSSKVTDPFLKKIIYLASVSYGVGDALEPSGGNAVHPRYKGVSQPVPISVGQIKPERIFINLGINELNGVPAEVVGKKYGQFIQQLKAASPSSKIYIIGLTYIVAGKEKQYFTNGGIRAYNDYLKAHSAEWGVTYLDLASRMTKDGTTLPAEYSSDGYVHHNEAGFAIWIQFLKDTAAEYINK